MNFRDVIAQKGAPCHFLLIRLSLVKIAFFFKQPGENLNFVWDLRFPDVTKVSSRLMSQVIICAFGGEDFVATPFPAYLIWLVTEIKRECVVDNLHPLFKE